MQNRKSYSNSRVFVGRIPHNSDLLGYITKILNEENVKVGEIKIYGYLQNLVLSEFDFNTKFTNQIEKTSEDGIIEICSLSGIISQFKGRASVKISGVFRLQNGEILGGTLGLGTKTYACEVIINEYEGATLSRDFDTETGLPLWKNSEL